MLLSGLAGKKRGAPFVESALGRELREQRSVSAPTRCREKSSCAPGASATTAGRVRHRPPPARRAAPRAQVSACASSFFQAGQRCGGGSSFRSDDTADSVAPRPPGGWLRRACASRGPAKSPGADCPARQVAAFWRARGFLRLQRFGPYPGGGTERGALRRGELAARDASGAGRNGCLDCKATPR